MRKLLKVLGAIAVFIVIAVTVVLVRANRRFDAPYPDIRASRDPNVIAAGRYIVYGAGHCAACHNDRAGQKAVEAGATPPLAGGGEFVLPVGTFHTPNLTPDAETGIGRLTDGEIARVLRYGVMPDGRASLPFMPYHDMSDEDLTAIVSFLRSQPPVHHAVPKHDLNFAGKAVLAFVIRPEGPSKLIRKQSPPQDGSVERGEYLANSVGECVGCHTKRSHATGAYLTARFSGGEEFGIEDDAKHVLVSPNLTPAPHGHIAKWSEEDFVARFSVPAGVHGTHMPWSSFQRMSENDKRAIYRYLRTLPPAHNRPGPVMQMKN